MLRRAPGAREILENSTGPRCEGTYAYGAVALQRGGAAARTTAFPEFVRKFYGASWSVTWSEIFDSYYSITPARPGCAGAWQGPILPNPWTTDAELHTALAAKPTEIPPF